MKFELAIRFTLVAMPSVSKVVVGRLAAGLARHLLEIEACRVVGQDDVHS